MSLFGEYYSYLYIPVILQAICLIHSYRRGTLDRWLWLIVFLPLVGSGIYIFTEMISARRRSVPRIDVGAIINPGARIKKMEEALRYSDTFNNRIQLADAYLDGGLTDKAIELYEGGLTGAFSENEHVLSQLVIAYYQKERYADAISTAQKINTHTTFVRSKAHLFYALSLEKAEKVTEAEKEFKVMIGRFSYYEQRYQYAAFLVRIEHFEDAEKVLQTMLEEEPQLSSMERKAAKQWFAKAREEMKRVA